MLLEDQMVPLWGREVLTEREQKEASELLAMMIQGNRSRCRCVHNGKIYGLNGDDVRTFLYIKITRPLPPREKNTLLPSLSLLNSLL